jgi:hypothetical protein
MAGLDFDPFGKSDPFSVRVPGLDAGGGMPRERAEFRRPLPEDEARSLGQRVLDTGVSGLSYVAGALNKPGRAVRGVLGGHPDEILAAIPFSDSLGITDPHREVSGRDLTNQLGLTDRHDKGWGSWGLGLAADVATDPLTYATFGGRHALNATGRALEKAGHLKGWKGSELMRGFDATESGLAAAGHTASDVAHAANQGSKIASPAAEALGAQAHAPLSGLVRISAPFFPDVGVTLGSGKAAQRVARGLEAAGDTLKYGTLVGRWANQLFDSQVHGAVDEVTQRGAAKYLDPALKELQATGRDQAFGVLNQLDPLIKAGAHPEAEITEAARAVAENAAHGFDPALVTQVTPLANDIRAAGAGQFKEARKAGAPLQDVGDKYAEYIHRQALDVNHANLQTPRNGNLYPVASGSNAHREEVFRDIPGATNRLNDWWKRFAGTTDKPGAAKVIRQELEQDLLQTGRAMDAKTAKAFDAKADALAERLAASDPRHVTDRLPLFTPNLAGDFVQRGAQHARTVASSRAAVGTLGDVAAQITPGSNLIPLTEALDTLGLKTYGKKATGGGPVEGALVEMYKRLAAQGAGKVDPFLSGPVKNLRAEVAKWGISPEHFDQITKAYQKWSTPEQLKSPLGFVDSMTNLFKGLAYPIWVPAHVRNAGTAAVNNLRSGTGWHDYATQLGIMRGTATPAQLARYGLGSIDDARRAQFASGNIFGGHGLSDDIAGSATEALLNTASRSGPGRFTPQLPGADRAGSSSLVGDVANLVGKEGLLDSLTATGRALRGSVAGLTDRTRRWGQSLGENLGIKGVGGVAKDVNPAVKAGRVAGTNIEDFFRGAQWLAETRKGASPAQAAEAVNRLHFDYDALTAFEKNVMRRAVPFYTFARKNLPLQLETLATRPGIIQAQTKPFIQPGDGQGYVPQYLNSGVAIPTGPEVDGKRQYVSKLGLPAEEAFERLHFRNGAPDVAATVMDYMGQLNPMVKAPLEQIFDTQFHTQRRLSDLKATGTASALGSLFGDDNPQWLGQVMSNSPFTRFFTTADKLADDRKSWPAKLANLLTGVNVTDVDTDKQRAIELRGALEDVMRTHPHFSRYSSFYIKPEDQASLTPEEIELMRLYSGVQDAAKAYAKQQRIGVRP